MRQALVLAALLGVACDDGGTDATDGVETDGGNTVDDILALTGDPASGEQVYVNNCTELCHLPEGTGEDDGGLGNNLNVVLPDLTDEEVVTIIVEGEGVMTAFGKGPDPLLTNQQIADVVAYIRSEFGGT